MGASLLSAQQPGSQGLEEIRRGDTNSIRSEAIPKQGYARHLLGRRRRAAHQLSDRWEDD